MKDVRHLKWQFCWTTPFSTLPIISEVLKKNKNKTFDYDTIMMMKMMVVVVVITSKLIFLLLHSINNPNFKE